MNKCALRVVPICSAWYLRIRVSLHEKSMLLSADFNFFASVAWRLLRPGNRMNRFPIAVRLATVFLVLVGQAIAAPQSAQQTTEAPKADVPKASAAKANASKGDAPKASVPKANASKANAPKASAAKASTQKESTPKESTPKESTPKETNTTASTPKESNTKASAPTASTSKSGSPKANARCPAQDFGRFLDLFSDNPNLQRRFTRLPLEFGEVIDPGYPEPSREFSVRMIESFDKIPLLDRGDGGRIFPSRTKRNRDDLVIVRERGMREKPEFPDERDEADDEVVLLFVGNMGFGVYFRFSRDGNCWFLQAIHNKSAWS